jgi:hypothetical protein
VPLIIQIYVFILEIKKFFALAANETALRQAGN